MPFLVDHTIGFRLSCETNKLNSEADLEVHGQQSLNPKPQPAETLNPKPLEVIIVIPILIGTKNILRVIIVLVIRSSNNSNNRNNIRSRLGMIPAHLAP